MFRKHTRSFPASGPLYGLHRPRQPRGDGLTPAREKETGVDRVADQRVGKLPPTGPAPPRYAPVSPAIPSEAGGTAERTGGEDRSEKSPADHRRGLKLAFFRGRAGRPG